VGWGQVRWSGGRIALPIAGMELDLGGYVKEYAADRVAALLRSQGCNAGPRRSRRRSRDRRPASGRTAVDRRRPRRVASRARRAVGAARGGRRRDERRLRALHGGRRRALRAHPRSAHGLAGSGPRERDRVRVDLSRRGQRVDDRDAPGRRRACVARRARPAAPPARHTAARSSAG
jgi:hypothetical protein